MAMIYKYSELAQQNKTYNTHMTNNTLVKRIIIFAQDTIIIVIKRIYILFFLIQYSSQQSPNTVFLCLWNKISYVRSPKFEDRISIKQIRYQQFEWKMIKFYSYTWKSLKIINITRVSGHCISATIYSKKTDIYIEKQHLQLLQKQ